MDRGPCRRRPWWLKATASEGGIPERGGVPCSTTGVQCYAFCWVRLWVEVSCWGQCVWGGGGMP